MSNILIIAPHADDEVLGCGGIIAKYTNLGFEVNIVIATNACKGAPELFSQSDIDAIREEAINAHKILGVKETVFLDLPAPALNAFPSYKISIELSKMVNKFQPRLVYLPHPGDLHLDHSAIYRAALVAVRPINNCSVKEVYCYETLSETDWSPKQGGEGFDPNCYEDISDYMQLKLDAMNCFKSQLKPGFSSRSLRSLKSLAEFRGGTISVEFGEAFELERLIR